MLSPRLSAGVDYEAFKNALIACRNWIISPQGSAQFREGFEFIGYPPSNQPFRLFQFHSGGDAADILIEVSEGITRFYVEDQDGTFHLFEEDVILLDEDDDFILVDEDDGFHLTAGVLISANPYSLSDLETLYFVNQANFGILCHGSHPPQVMTLFFDGSLNSINFAKENIPIFNYVDIRNPGFAATSGQWRINFPANWTTRQYAFNVSYNGVVAKNVNDSLVTYTFDIAATNETNIAAGLLLAAQAQNLAATFVVAVVANSNDLVYDVTVSGLQGGWPITVTRQFAYYWGNFDPAEFIEANSPIVQNLNLAADTIEEPAWSYPAIVIHEVPAASGEFRYYQVTQTHISTAETEPGIGVDYTDVWQDLGLPVPVGYDYQYPAGNVWLIDTSYAPLGRGFPTVAAFHDQRLIYMANKSNPTALYGSAIGRYSSFEPGPEGDQPFIFILDSSDTPTIKWAVSQLDLLLGTSSGDWRIGAEVTITPTDINANRQNKARSQLTMAAQIDTEIFYVEQGFKKLRVTQYVRNLTSFSSTDASILAESLVSDGIKRVTTSFLPETLIALVRNNGQPLFLTYAKEVGMMAYTEVETDAFINDVSAYYSLFETQDFTYWASQRNNRYTLEKLRYPCGKTCSPLTANNIVCMDSWVKGIVTGFEISGLDHLNGKEVGVLINDAWQIKTFTVANGKIALPEDFTGRDYAVGLLYVGYLETFENPDNTQGTGLGTKRRWSDLYTRLYNSALPRVFNRRDADRSPPVPMGISENVREGLHDIRQNVSGFDKGSIIIVQDRPYPTQVLAFFGSYQVEDDG